MQTLAIEESDSNCVVVLDLTENPGMRVNAPPPPPAASAPFQALRVIARATSPPAAGAPSQALPSNTVSDSPPKVLIVIYKVNIDV
jgi:hypothetical protein